MIFDEAQLEAFIRGVVNRVLAERSGASVLEENLGKDEVAEMLGVTGRTITTWMKRQGIPHEHRGGRPRFKRTEVLTWWSNFDRRPHRKAG